MNLKLVTGVLLTPLIATNVAQAHESHKAHGGFSIGAQAGYISGNSNLNREFPLTVPAPTNDSTNLSGTGAIGGINLGYGHVFQNSVFTGLELSGNLSGLKGEMNDARSTGAFKVDLKMKDSLGGAFKLGGVFHNVLAYAKFGVVTSKFESQGTRVFLTTRSNKRTKRLTGFELGAGVDFPVHERITIGAEYSHVWYNKISYSVQTPGSTLPFLNVSIKPRTDTFMLRAKYRFW